MMCLTQLLEEAKSAEKFLRENIVQAVKTGTGDENVYSKLSELCLYCLL